MKTKTINTDWAKLSDATQKILERFDIYRMDEQFVIGQEIDIPYFKGIFTEDIANEIFAYQYSKENQGYYSVTRDGNKVFMKFIKGALD